MVPRYPMTSLPLPSPLRTSLPPLPWPGALPMVSPTLARTLLLALLLHVWLVLLLGNAPGGTAQPGQGVWGAINVTLRDRLWEGAATKGSYLIEKVQDLVEEFAQVYEKVTGKGLLIGQHFRTPELGYKVASELFKRGVLVAGTLTSAQTIRIEPPLIISQEEIDEGLNRLTDAVGVVAKAL